MTLRTALGSLMGLLAGLGAAAAFGDGECVKGARDSTPEERAVMTEVLETLQRALPAAPAGWVILGDDQLSVPSSMCQDYGQRPWGYGYTRYYQRVEGQEARDAVLAKAAEVAQADIERKRPQAEAFEAQLTKLGQQAVEAGQKGDYARVDALNEQMAKISDDYQKLLDEGPGNDAINAASAEVSKDQTMTIMIEVNSNGVPSSPDAESLPPPAGAQAAFGWHTVSNDANESHEVVLYGHWHDASDGGTELVMRPSVPLSRVHTLSVHVSADESRLAGAIASIDFDSIGNLVR